jgi:sulfite exporter TauE/SafE
MLASITPLGERSRRQHWGVTVAALAVGATAAAAALGAVLGVLGSVLPPAPAPRALALAAIVAAAVLLDIRAAVPTHRRQVDEGWLRRYRGWVYGVGFGAQLGVGLATVVTTAAVYAALVAELLAPSVTWAAAIGATFGLGRALPLLLARRIRSPRELAAFHRRFAGSERAARAAAIALQALVVAAIAVTA